MYNPTKAAVANSVVLRILTYEIAIGKTKQFAYTMENTTLTGCSEILAVNVTTFLTIERDGLYGGNPSTFKKIFKIDVSNATDISDATNSATGKLYNDKNGRGIK